MRPFGITFLILLAITGFSQKPRDFRNEAILLKDALQKNHFSPRIPDDRFSREVFRQLLKRLDPNRTYFSEEDIKPLLKYETVIDDELNGNGWAFFNALKQTYRRCVERSGVSATQLLQSPFNWKIPEYYLNDTSRWLPDEQALIDRQRLFLKYETLQRLTAMVSTEPVAPDFVTKNESEARQRVKASVIRQINRVLKHPAGFESHFASQFFQAITSVYDPHTSYLSATDMENFMSMLSTEGYYFGLTLEENETGEISIASLTPGGPAWRSGELNAADVLLTVKWESAESFDFTGITVEEANEILSDANHSDMELTVRKSDGIRKTVRIRKAKISVEDSYVRSFVLRGKNRIGYIYLPDFYTRWGNSGEGSQCASDVAREILKLRKENIEGLILDIRYNGGGSLQEAIALAGIFIDEGTLGYLKNSEQRTVSLKDINRGTVYDGPLLLMVNGQSASASEFLAAALQDYNRAIITGSRTFGKATAQNIFPLEKIRQEQTSLASIKNDVGYSTITIEKLYRATGKTAQGRGVWPDINLPDIFEALNMHEQDLPFAFPADSLDKKNSLKASGPLPLKQLKDRSASRIDSSSAFHDLKKVYSWLSARKDMKDAPVLLTWQSALKEHMQTVARQAVVKKEFSHSTKLFELENNTVDLQRISVDDYAREQSLMWSGRLKKDIYLAEAFQIISDYIDLPKKP